MSNSKDCGCGSNKNNSNKSRNCNCNCNNSPCEHIIKMQKRTLIVAVILATPLVAIDDSGNFYGFDIDLVNEIARRLCFKKVIFKLAANVSELLSLVKSGEVDMTGISALSITSQRLESLGFVAINTTSHRCLPMFFKNQIYPGITSGATAMADIAILIQNGDPILVGDGGGPGSIQRTTFNNAGIPDSRLINASGPEADIQKIIDAFVANKYQALYIGFDENASNILKTTAAQQGVTLVSLDCVPLDKSVQVRALGYAYTKDSCKLMMNTQCALDDIITDHTYEGFVYKTKHDPRFSQEDRDSFDPLVPTLCYSIINRYIPRSCLC